MNSEEELILLFQNIKNRGWIETNRHGDQCLGNTFENLIGKEEDNKAEADFKGIELKSHRLITKSLVSLFSKSPSYPKAANTYLREEYGVTDSNEFGKKMLYTTISGNKYNSHRGGHNFKFDVDRNDKKLWLLVKDSNTDVILEGPTAGKCIYWDFSVIENALEKKLKKIAILYGNEKDENGKHYVQFTKMKLLEGLTLEKMLSALELGDLYLDIRIGVYESGKNIGKTHDHGSGFRMKLEKLLSYATVKDVE